MKAKVASSGLEYGIAVTAISVPVMVLGAGFAKITGTVFEDLLSQLSLVVSVLGG